MRYWETAKPKTTRAKSQKASPARRSTVASGGSLRDYPFLRRFYRHQATLSERLQKFIFFTVVATLLYAFVFGEAGVLRITSLKHQKASLEQEIAMLDTDIDALQDQIDRLKDDPFMMEKLGRERYGLVYPGDKVYKIIRPQQRR